MVNVIIIEKNKIKENTISDISELFKKCKFKKLEGFDRDSFMDI